MGALFLVQILGHQRVCDVLMSIWDWRFVSVACVKLRGCAQASTWQTACPTSLLQCMTISTAADRVLLPTHKQYQIMFDDISLSMRKF